MRKPKNKQGNLEEQQQRSATIRYQNLLYQTLECDIGASVERPMESDPHIYDHLSCNLGGTGGRAFFQKMVLDKLNIYGGGGSNLDSCFMS